jgi:hypothetical protein
MAAASELHIVVPGVCGPLAETRSLENNCFVKNWIGVLSRSGCGSSLTSMCDVIASIFDLSIDGDFPSAALSILALDRYDMSLDYMFADPVHMQADMDHALLTSSADLAISEHESDTFCEMLNQHFNQDGLCFIRIDKNQWLVSSKKNIQMNTTPLSHAIGRNVNFILPEGEDAGYWKQKLTEAQMLMHVHDINVSRENAGQQSINSLWFHGSGNLPEFNNGRVDSICSNHIMFKGLASHVQCDYQPLTESVVEYMSYLSGGNTGAGTVNVLHLSDLEHLANYADVNIWSGKLEEVLDLWIYPLLKMANKNDIKVTLYPCNGKQYQFSRYDAFKFWRQEKLQQHVSCY